MKKHAAVLFFTCCLIYPAGPAGSQVYSASPCEKTSNPGLKGKIRSGKIDKLTWMGRWHLGMYVCEWSTSFLKATGARPSIPKNMEDDADAGSDYEEAYENWSCMYSARSAMDKNPKTAWCEGKKDNGIGEILLVRVDTARPVKIWAGLGASPGLHKQNSRPKNIRVYVLQAKKASMDAGQYALIIKYQDITVLGKSEITLRDVNGYQPLALPKHRRSNSVEQGREPVKITDTTFVAIEILSVYPGTKYKDTCISEVGN